MIETSPANRHPWWNVWGNPIFRRYCRSRLRLRGLGVALLISVLIAGFLFFMLRATSMYRVNFSVTDAYRAPLIPLLEFQALIMFVLGTAQVSGGMTAETDEGVIDYQRLIPMSPFSKVVGYLFGLPVREYAMFLSTLPFTAWALWKGEVAFQVWAPLYAVFMTTAVTYHFTGMLTGTVVRNRRWAFLASIGLVFCLYTVIPQMAKFGLVFFKYVTITPVLEEILPGILPKTVGALWFPGQVVPLKVLGFYVAVMLSGGLGFHALLEAKGLRTIGLMIIFVGIVPLMIGAIMSVSNDRVIPAATWFFGISPASAPLYASASLLDIAELPAEAARSIPRAFYFWQGVSALTAGWLIVRLHGARKSIAGSAINPEPADPPPTDL